MSPFLIQFLPVLWIWTLFLKSLWILLAWIQLLLLWLLLIRTYVILLLPYHHNRALFSEDPQGAKNFHHISRTTTVISFKVCLNPICPQHQFQLLQVILILYQRFFHMNLYPLLIKPFLSNSLRILNQEAMKKLHNTTCWRQAMAAEFHALQANNTWELVNLPPNKKAIGCK